MSKTMQLFQTFNDDILERSRPNVVMKYWYSDTSASNTPLMEFINSDKSLILEDENDGWDFASYGLGLTGELTFYNSDALFGINGLVNEDAILGVALRYYSKKTSIQKIMPIGDIRYNNNLRMEFTHMIARDEFFGDLFFEVVIYVKHASEKGSFGKPNIEGTIIDYIWSMKINLDGVGGVFPITTVNDKNRSLWYVEFNYTDPFNDPFESEYVNICINAAHAQYTHIMNKKSKVGNLILEEIMTGALLVILQKVLNDPAATGVYDEDLHADLGSIVGAIRYLHKAVKWKSNDPENIAESLRSYFQQNSGVEDTDD